MKSVLVVSCAAEGSSGAIAEALGAALRARGAKVEVLDATSPAAAQVQPFHAAAILCGSLAHAKDCEPLVRFVKENRDWFVGIPAAFVAIGAPPPTAGDAGGDLPDVLLERFGHDTGWTPAFTCSLDLTDAGRTALEGFVAEFVAATGIEEHGH